MASLQKNTINETEFKNAWFWISGGSAGMGLAVAQALAKRGASLFLMARNESELTKQKETLLKFGAPEVIVAPLDISEETTGQKASLALGKVKLRGILLNGGGPHGKQASSLEWEDFDTAHRLLFSGPVNLLTHLIPSLETPGGSVVAITSTTVRQPNGNLPLSGAYRTALVALLKNLSDELGPRGIRVNNVAPGYVDTHRLKDLANYVAETTYNGADPETLERVTQDWSSLSALKRIGTPWEIAETCAFLFSEAAGYMTGQTLVVDGGQMRGY